MMNDKYKFDDVLREQFYEQDDNSNLLVDNRVLKSYVEDIDGGDNFADYCEYIFNLYEEEDYYEN